MSLINADVLLESIRESAKKAEEWLADCKAYKSNMTARAEQAILTFNECALRIKNAPTLDAVPVRHGRWKTVEDWDGDEHYQCSVCGAEFVLIDGDPNDNDYLYCPHCGAKMNEEDNEQHD